MAQKPFLALVIPTISERSKPGGPPGQRPGGPPGQGPGGGGPPGQQPDAPSHPIYIEPPEMPEVDLPPGSKLVLVWDGEELQWAVLSGGRVSNLPAPTPAPKK